MQMGREVRFALNHPSPLIHMQVENQRGQLSREPASSDEAGACACSSDAHGALEAQLVGGIQGHEGAVRSPPDRSPLAKAALTQVAADR